MRILKQVLRADNGNARRPSGSSVMPIKAASSPPSPTLSPARHVEIASTYQDAEKTARVALSSDRDEEFMDSAIVSSGWSPCAQDDETDDTFSPSRPPTSIADMKLGSDVRHEERYRTLLKHDYDPSRTSSLVSISS